MLSRAIEMIFKSTDEIENKNYQVVLIKKIWQFSAKNDLFMADNFEKIVRGENVTNHRLLWVTFTRICLIMTGIRFILMAIFWNTPIASTLLADIISSSGLKQGRIINTILGVGILNISFFGIIFQYFEHGNSLKIANVIHLITKNRPPIRLGFRSNRRLTIVLHLMTKYMLRQTYAIIFCSTLSCYIYLDIILIFRTIIYIDLDNLVNTICYNY